MTEEKEVETNEEFVKEEETITEEIEATIKDKEEELEGFDDVKADEIEDEELDHEDKYRTFKTIGYVFILAIGCLALIKGGQKAQKDDKSVVEVQRDE